MYLSGMGGLRIADGEVIKAAKITRKELSFVKLWYRFYYQLMMNLAVFLLLGILLPQLGEVDFIWFWLVIVGFLVFINFYLPYDMKTKYRNFYKLYEHIKSFNLVIKQLNQLVNINELENGEGVINALTMVRNNLLYAIVFERELRGNPNLSSDEFMMDLSVLQELQVGEAGFLLNKIIEIGGIVEADIRSFKG